MRNLAILLLAIFVCASCTKKDRVEYDGISGGSATEDSVEYDDFGDVKEHYHQILLKKWQQNANWQEQAGSLLDSMQNPLGISIDDAWDTAQKALKEYYNIVPKEEEFVSGMSYIDKYWLIRYRPLYKKEQMLIRYRPLYKKEQIWILISGFNGKILSTYKDKWQVAKKSAQEMRDEKKRKQEERREQYINSYYKHLIHIWKLNIAETCPSLSNLSYTISRGNVNSVHLQKVDSINSQKSESIAQQVLSDLNLRQKKLNILSRKLDSLGSTSTSTFMDVSGRFDSIDSRVFQQKLQTLYGFQNDIKNVDSVTAIKIATVAAAMCYGSEMTSFNAMLMGDNKEHWVVYCFPTIPDNIELQRECCKLRILQQKEGKGFTLGRRCPIVFTVLISRENGQVLSIEIP
jgi:hypothetical protein